MELFDHIKRLKEIDEVKDFIKKHQDNKNNFFGINYKNKERVSFKLYSTINNLEDLKEFDPVIYKLCEKYTKFMWYTGNKKDKELHIGLKLKNNKINRYFHCKFRPDVYLFSLPYPECSFQGMSVESDGDIRPYFYYFNKEDNYANLKKCYGLKTILNDLNCKVSRSCDEIHNIEYTVTKKYKKINIGIKIAPFDEFLNLDEQAVSDSILLKKLFDQEIITTGKYNDDPDPTIAVYYYKCFNTLLNQI